MGVCFVVLPTSAPHSCYSSRVSLLCHLFFRCSHKLGTNSSEDVLMFEETDELNALYMTKTEDEKFIILSRTTDKSSATLFLRADQPFGRFQPLFEPQVCFLLTSSSLCSSLCSSSLSSLFPFSAFFFSFRYLGELWRSSDDTYRSCRRA